MRKWTPMKKHPNVYEYPTAKGKRYGIRRTYQNSEGKRQEYTKSGFLTWRDADIVLKQFEVDLSDGKVKNIENSNTRFETYFYEMARRKHKLGFWKNSTYAISTGLFKRYLQKPFGNLKLTEITRSGFQKTLDDLAAGGLSDSTLHSISVLMNQVMNDAEVNDVILKNKLRGTKTKGKEPKKISLEPQDFNKWMHTAQEMLPPYQLSMVYMATLGERRGELMGLREDSIEFSYDEVNKQEIASIKFDLQRTPFEINGTTLKTESSYRTIWITGELIKYLKIAMKRAKKLREQNNIPVDTPKWIWLNSRGNPSTPVYLNRIMKRVSDYCGIHITPHMLRHYFATEAISSNTPQMDVMHWLGHSNLQMTADYTRPTKPSSLEVYKNIDNSLNLFNDPKNGTKS